MSGPDLWLARFRPVADPRVRLVCVPYAGGGASVFREWARELPAWIELVAVKLPGRESRFGEPAHERVETLVEELGPAVVSGLDRPFALFGHSMGAVVAFELARWLRRRRHPLPVRLFLSARKAPDRPDRLPPVHELPDAEFVAALRARYGSHGGALDHPELVVLMLPTLRADVAVCERHAPPPEPPLDLPVSVFGGTHDPTVEREDLEAWNGYTTGSFSLTLFPGDHFFLAGERPAVLRRIVDELAPWL